MSDTKAGHDIHENVMRMSLLKAAMTEDRWEDYGTRKFTYRLVFHSDSFVKTKIPQLHDELVYPVVKGDKQPESTGRFDTETAFVKVSDDQVILDTLKVAEDGIDGFICRFYDAAGGSRKATVEFPLLLSDEWEDPVVVNLLEEPIYTMSKKQGDKLSFEVKFHPFEIVSILIKRKQ